MTRSHAGGVVQVMLAVLLAGCGNSSEGSQNESETRVPTSDTAGTEVIAEPIECPLPARSGEKTRGELRARDGSKLVIGDDARMTAIQTCTTEAQVRAADVCTSGRGGDVEITVMVRDVDDSVFEMPMTLPCE